MTAPTITRGPNADVVHYSATRAEEHRRNWETVGRNAEKAISAALATLEEEALSIFRVEDKRPGRWRRLPPNLGHLLDLAVGAAESSVAAAELDLAQARKHTHRGDAS